MQEAKRTIDEVPIWVSKILLNDREWPLYKSDIEITLKCTASDYLPEYSIRNTQK